MLLGCFYHTRLGQETVPRLVVSTLQSNYKADVRKQNFLSSKIPSCRHMVIIIFYIGMRNRNFYVVTQAFWLLTSKLSETSVKNWEFPFPFADENDDSSYNEIKGCTKASKQEFIDDCARRTSGFGCRLPLRFLGFRFSLVLTNILLV